MFIILLCCSSSLSDACNAVCCWMFTGDFIIVMNSTSENCLLPSCICDILVLGVISFVVIDCAIQCAVCDFIYLYGFSHVWLPQIESLGINLEF
jgi:hypothetical protein